MMNPMTEQDMITHLRRMSSGGARTMELFVTVKLGIPDLLENEPRTAADLAKSLGVNPDSLFRFLRLLVVREILHVDEDGCFSLAPLGELLKTSHPKSMRPICLYSGEIGSRVGMEMLYAVQTGQSAFEKAFGRTFFETMAQDTYLSNLFNEVMSSNTLDRAMGIIQGYDFSPYKNFVDVGGGKGTLAACILEKYPHTRGIILDIPSVAPEAEKTIQSRNYSDRCSFIPGDFFLDALPEEMELYILSNIIHDWDDHQAAIILKNCTRAMLPSSKLLIIEQIIPEKITSGLSVIGSDMSMLLLGGGARERTLKEFQKLLQDCALTLGSIYPFTPEKNYSVGSKTDWAVIECQLKEPFPVQ